MELTFFADTLTAEGKPGMVTTPGLQIPQ